MVQLVVDYSTSMMLQKIDDSTAATLFLSKKPELICHLPSSMLLLRMTTSLSEIVALLSMSFVI